jgi:hypothetical protein
MRTRDGVTAAELPAPLVEALVAEGLAEPRGDRICPTLRGFLFADRVAARIVQAASDRSKLDGRPVHDG